MKLSAIQVRNAKPQEKPYKIPDGKGLYLHISKAGKKTWRYRYRFDGKESTLVLGEYPQLSLESARKDRVTKRELLDAGKNPALERKLEKQRYITDLKREKQKIENSFENVANEWWRQQRDRWSDGHAKAVIGTLKADVFPFIGDLPIDEITPPEILTIVQSIEKRGALEIAKKTLQRITAVFRYAVQTGRAPNNPATEMRGVLKKKKVRHHPMIKPEELPVFLRTLTAADIHITTKLALKFTILTSARSGEVRFAVWDEIDFDNRLWRIPAKRMKMKKDHTVPLSKQAISILKEMHELFGKMNFIFPGIHYPGKALSENTLLYTLHRIGYHGKATVHGFRALFSTISNKTGFNPDAIERQLAHRERNQVRAAYHRSEYLEQRRELMQWWADLLQKLEQSES